MTHTTLCITVPNTKWPLQHTSDWQTRHHHPLAVWYRFRKTWLKITTSLMHALSRNVPGVTSLWAAVSWVKVRRLTPSLGAMITTADGGGRRLEKCIIISWFHWFISDEGWPGLDGFASKCMFPLLKSVFSAGQWWEAGIHETSCSHTLWVNESIKHI